jgi:hypothetical protein
MGDEYFRLIDSKYGVKLLQAYGFLQQPAKKVKKIKIEFQK